MSNLAQIAAAIDESTADLAALNARLDQRRRQNTPHDTHVHLHFLIKMGYSRALASDAIWAGYTACELVLPCDPFAGPHGVKSGDWTGD